MNQVDLFNVAAVVVLAMPLLLVIVLGIPSVVGRPLGERWIGRWVRLTIGLGLIASLFTLAWMLSFNQQHIAVSWGNWAQIPGYHFSIKFVFDRLAVPFVILTFVLSGTIGTFAVKYMHREPGFNRFFVLYSFFVFGMVVTSLAGTIETLFTGWELVGLSSALLVGFFQDRLEPVRNGLRVWIVYRIADAAMLLGVVVLHHLVGHGDFDVLLGAGSWPFGQADITMSQALAVGLLFLVSAELQLDNYFFGQSTESRETVGDIPDGAAFRRARIAALGNYSITEYRLEVDFAQPGRPSFLDIWGAINDLPVVGQLKIGNFFEPIGLERLTSNRFAPFMERNLPDQPYDPQRSPGIQFHNTHHDNHGVWTLGVFRPRIDNFGDGVADAGDWAVDGRFTVLPWYDEESGGRYYMHFGTANSYRRTTDNMISFRAQPEARLGASTPNVPFFVDTGNIAANAYRLHNVEFACSLGSLYLQGEYFLVPVDQLSGANLLFTGWYVQSGYFLTGEHRPFRRETATFDRVQPFTEFFRVRTRQGVQQGMGAWEIATRISQVDLTDANIGGGKLIDLTIGLNWYLTPYMRITSNYVHAFLDPAVTSRTGADIFGIRMQYEF